MDAAPESAPQIILEGVLYPEAFFVPAPSTREDGRSADLSVLDLYREHLPFKMLYYDFFGPGTDERYSLELRRIGQGTVEEEGAGGGNSSPIDCAMLVARGMEVLSWDEEWQISHLPARHLFLTGEMIKKPFIKRAIQRHAVTLGLHWPDAVAHLPHLLDELPPSSPLRNVFLFVSHTWELHGETETIRLVDALKRSSRIQQVYLCSSVFIGDVYALLGPLLYSMTSFGFHFAEEERDPMGMGPTRQAASLKELQCDVYTFRSVYTSLSSGITRLYIYSSWMHPNLKDRETLWKEVMRNCASMEFLVDLGFDCFDAEQMADLVDRKIHTRIRTLRLLVPFSTVLRQTLQCLRDPGCTIQFLSFTSSAYHATDGLRDLAQYISSDAAHNLVDCALRFSPLDGGKLASVTEAEWELANSLNNNFTLCHLHYKWSVKAAETYAISLLHRNRLYRDTGLLTEEQVKPGLAKLFVCGHPEVGKTTLCEALLSIQKDRQFPLCLGFKGCFQNRQASPDRTRGMEIRRLAFKGQGMKLVLCDLAGQQEYHVFHHYFMNATQNDIFIVVCKMQAKTVFEDFQRQLKYWLRFIVSHRSSRKNVSYRESDVNHTNCMPKVIVVVNFFQQGEIENTTKDWTSSTMDEFSEIIDFDFHPFHQEYRNRFGLSAKTSFGVSELYDKLESLLQHIGRRASPIPKLCHDISECLTSERGRQNWLRRVPLRGGIGERRLTTTFEAVCTMLSEHHRTEPANKIQTALLELNAQGYVIYIPLEEAYGDHKRFSSAEGESGSEVSRETNTLVIIDTNWFSSKLIGSLLDSRQKGSTRTYISKWSIAEIKRLLREQSCREDALDEIVRYLLNLELCVSLGNNAAGDEEHFLLFPALVKKKNIEFPKEWTASTTRFFGRRIKCKDPSVHLIPFAVFTRLQVNLHKNYSANTNRSFEHGYGWVSVMSGRVGVVVRFGGDVIREREGDESKQWVDILTFCVGDHRSGGSGGNQSQPTYDSRCNAAAEKEVEKIRVSLYNTCRGGELGRITTVDLDEMVLQNHTAESDDCSLASVLEKAKTEGLHEAYQSWGNRTCTPVLELLLPKEIKDFVDGMLAVLQTIQEEYRVVDTGEGAGSRDRDLEPTVEELEGPFQILDRNNQVRIAGLTCLVTRNFEMVQKSLEDIRAVVGRLESGQREIIANCSTRLLRRELRKDRGYPLYPYSVDEKGKLAPLRRLLRRKEARIHFLCESPSDGIAHVVKEQKGKLVTMEWAPWLKTAARAMAPAVRVICCLARFAVAMHFPGALSFIPTGETLHALLSELGVSMEALNGVVLPMVMKTLLEEVEDVEWERRRPGEEEAHEFVGVLLKQMGEVDMKADFGLTRVMWDDEQHQRTFWVCDHHARGLPQTQQQSFS